MTKLFSAEAVAAANERSATPQQRRRWLLWMLLGPLVSLIPFLALAAEVLFSRPDQLLDSLLSVWMSGAVQTAILMLPLVWAVCWEAWLTLRPMPSGGSRWRGWAMLLRSLHGMLLLTLLLLLVPTMGMAGFVIPATEPIGRWPSPDGTLIASVRRGLGDATVSYSVVVAVHPPGRLPRRQDVVFSAYRAYDLKLAWTDGRSLAVSTGGEPHINPTNRAGVSVKWSLDASPPWSKR